MKVEFYENIGNENVLISKKELPIDEIEVYTKVYRGAILKKLHYSESTRIRSEDNLVDDEVVRIITIYREENRF